jgi:serine/threonine-protein kinase
VDIASQIAQGLYAAHSRGVVHRDLKPDNVMIVEDTVKIMDFGLAADAAQRDDFSGMVVGTPYYISPEQWNHRPADARSDLYSLGVMLYAMACSRKPFEASTMAEMQRLHVSVVPRPPHEIRREVSQDLSYIIVKLLEKDPDRRYQTAKELLDDLTRLRRGEEVQATGTYRRRSKCPFCEALNPPEARRCGVCSEALGEPPATLDLDVRSHERQCPACRGIFSKEHSACPYCRRP